MRLYEKTASELSEMLKNKECSAVELCNDVLARINETENKIGAYVTVAEESAKENAKKIIKWGAIIGGGIAAILLFSVIALIIAFV